MREEALRGSLTWAKEKGGVRRKLEGMEGRIYGVFGSEESVRI